MEAERKIEAGVDERPIESRRHRAASEVRFAETKPAAALPTPTALPPSARARPLATAVRDALWAEVRAELFAGNGAPHAPSGALRRAWTSPPIGGAPRRIPEDVGSVLEAWMGLVEPGDVFAFLENVHDGLEPILQSRFASTINAVLERGLSDHRFVLGRLMPIASRSDVASVERALNACRAMQWSSVEAALREALASLAQKPAPDPRRAIQAAARAVEQAALALMKEHYFDLEDALADLEAKGHIPRSLRAAYSGLFDHVGKTTHKTTTDDARLIVVMCSTFVSHLSSRAAADHAAR